jgi:AraC family transcriptional regulator of adaptative response / DNA-3-methyladenine glycosylase II
MAGTVLETTAPFDGAGLLRYLAGHAIPGVEDGDEGFYRRRVRLGGAIGLLEARLTGRPDAVLASFDGGPLPPPLVPRVRRLLDLDADSAAVDARLAADPVLAPSVAANPGIRLPGSLDPHEELFRTLVGQQISIAATRAVLGRICRELCGESGLFPTAGQLAERGREVLRGPAARVAAIHGAALALASGALIVDDTLPVDVLTARLVALPGIGPWTAGYVAMRALGAPDVLLTTDLVLLKGAERLGLPTRPRELAAHAVRWAPFRSYAGLHLWRAAQSPG